MTCGPWRDEARTQRVELTKRVVSFGRRSAWQEVWLSRKIEEEGLLRKFDPPPRTENKPIYN